MSAMHARTQLLKYSLSQIKPVAQKFQYRPTTVYLNRFVLW